MTASPTLIARPSPLADVRSDLAERPAWDSVGVQLLLFIALAFAPFAFGASEPWSQQVVLGLVFAALLLLTVGRLVRRAATPILWTWAYVPVGLLLGAACLQLVPLPAGLLHTISPGTAAIRDPLLRLADQTIPARETISLYPLATERELRLLFGGAAMFALVVQFYGSGNPVRLQRLLLWISTVGLGVASLAIWQNFSGARTIYGIARAGHPYSGPFANHSHFGQFLNLSLGAGLALLLIRVRELKRSGVSRAGLLEELQRRANWDVPLVVVFLVIGPVAVLLSLTRGGTLSLLCDAAVAVLLVPLVDRRATGDRDRSIAGGLAIALASVVVLMAIGFDAVYDRLATLRDVDNDGGGGRTSILRDAIALWEKVPAFGSGLGTHAFVFPMFDRSTVGGWATHAENEYVQMLEEVGSVGLLCLVAFVGIVFWSLANGIRRPTPRATRLGAGVPASVALPGLALGLIAVALHSWTDFGQHLPAVGFMTALTCGLVVACSRISPGPGGNSRRDVAPRKASSLLIHLTAVSMVLLAGGWALAGASRDREAAEAWDAATYDRQVLDAKGWAIDSPFYRDLLTNGSQAAAIQPRDVEYAFWLNTWRWEAIAQQAAPNGVLDDQLAGWTRQIAEGLCGTARDCPTFGRPMAFAGELLLRLGNDPATARRRIERGAALASYDASACFAAGRVAAVDGRAADASVLIGRAVALGMPARAAIEVFVDTLQQPASAIPLAEGNLTDLRYLADRLAARPEDAALMARVRQSYDALLAARASEPSASADTLALFADQLAARGEPDRAIATMGRAVALEYGNVDRRLGLALMLSQAKRAGEAVEQARICLRLRPGLPAAQELIASAGVAPLIANDASTDRSQRRMPN